jgi:hypothetical protein
MTRHWLALLCALSLGTVPALLSATDMPDSLAVVRGCCACIGCSAADSCNQESSVQECDQACTLAGCRQVVFSLSATCDDACGSAPAGSEPAPGAKQ